MNSDVVLERERVQSMLSLSDFQLRTVMNAAALLPVAKREVFLWRLSARRQLQTGRFDDDALERAIKLAMTGLVQSVA